MVLPDRRCPTRPLLLSRSSLPPLTLALRQRPHHAVGTQQRPTCQWDQFYVVGHRRFHISMVYEALPLPLVATVQLSALSGTRCRSHHWHVRYILFAANAVERGHQRQLVGKYCMAEYGGRAVDSSQGTRSGRKIWTKHVVVILFILYHYCSNTLIRTALQNSYSGLFTIMSWTHSS